MRASLLFLSAFLWVASWSLGGQARSAQTDQPLAGNLNPLDLSTVPPRPASLGSAFVGVGDDVSCLLFNPAGLSRLTRQEGSLFADAGWDGTLRGSALWALPLGTDAGLGFSGSYVGYGPIEGFDDLGAPTSGYAGDKFLLQAGGAWAPEGKVSFGGSLRMSYQSLPGYDMTFLTPDLGVLYEPVEDLKFGVDFALPVLGPSGFPWVSTLKGGFSWKKALDAEIQTLLLGGLVHEFGNADWVQGGIEVAYRSTYFLRMGYQTTFSENAYQTFSEFTFGAGMVLGDFRLDYAFLPSGDLGSAHRFSTSFFWGERASSLGGGPGKEGTSGPLKGQGLEGPSEGKSLGEGIHQEGPANGTQTQPSKGVGNKAGTTEGSSSVPTQAAPTVSPGMGVVTPGPSSGKDEAKERKEGLTLEFDIPPDFVAQAEGLESQDKLEEAREAYESALAQDPKNVEAWWKLGQLEAREGHRAAAIRRVQKALEIRPDRQDMKDWLEKYRTQGMGSDAK